MKLPPSHRFAPRTTASLVLLVGLVVSGPVIAQSSGGPSKEEITPPRDHQAPEQAAIDACASKKDGDRVRFTQANGKKRRWGCSTVDGVRAARSGVATAAFPSKNK